MAREFQHSRPRADAVAKLRIGIAEGRGNEASPRAMNDQIDRLRQGFERAAKHVAGLPAAQPGLPDLGLGGVAMTDADHAVALRAEVSRDVTPDKAEPPGD